VAPANSCDAHRKLAAADNLAAILSHVEKRNISNGCTVQYDGRSYQTDSSDIRAGMRGAKLRVELRLGGSVAMRFQGRYVRIQLCEHQRW
jgi:hypothetical protein